MSTTVRNEDFVEVTGGSIVLLSGTGEPTGRRVPIGPEPCLVGRGAHCHLVVTDPLVSTSHCELTATDRGVFVRDLGSTNGTSVNHALLKEGVWLTADFKLRCGESWFLVRVDRTEQVALSSAGSFGPLVGRSEAMRQIYKRLDQIAPHDLGVLIAGETGTGKELVARAVHDASPRHGMPFVVIDCTAIPGSLAESWLFGHEKGAFTGATERKVSRLIEARGGTIFFDELGELPLELQPKLLRALQERAIQSVGSTQYKSIDVRIVAATRRDLHTEVNAGRFRSDLYYRIAQVTIDLPPLRARRDDIPDLVTRFLTELGDPSAVTRIDKRSRERLLRDDWPGNVRELRSVVHVAYAQSNGGPIDFVEAMSGRARFGASADPSYERRLHAFDLEYFTSLYGDTRGNQSEMARRAGMPRTTLRSHLERLKLLETDDEDK